MVNALINLNEDTNRVLNIVKAKHGLKDKGEAIEFVIKVFIEQQSDPEIRPEFVKKMHEIERQKSVSVDDFSSRYGLI